MIRLLQYAFLPEMSIKNTKIVRIAIKKSHKKVMSVKKYLMSYFNDPFKYLGVQYV